jgi:hypothetical protein
MATTMTIKWKGEEEQVRTRMACQRDRCCHFLQYFLEEQEMKLSWQGS